MSWSSSSSDVAEVQTESAPESEKVSSKHALKYLMGLKETDEFENEGIEVKVDIVEEKEVQKLTGATESMRQAQKYLQVHRIFECFQFIIAHMLSALPGKQRDFVTMYYFPITIPILCREPHRIYCGTAGQMSAL